MYCSHCGQEMRDDKGKLRVFEICPNPECDNNKNNIENEFFHYPHPPNGAEVSDVPPPPSPVPDPEPPPDPSRLPVIDGNDPDMTIRTIVENPNPVKVALCAVDAPDEQSKYSLSQGTYIVGRKKAQVALNSRNVSREHAKIQVAISAQSVPHITIEDLGSDSGTFVNGERLEPEILRTLQASDVVQFARLKYRLEIVFDSGGSRDNQKQERTSGTLEYGNGRPSFMKS